MYVDVQQLRNDILSFNLKFKITKCYPIKKQEEKADTAYFMHRKYAPSSMSGRSGHGILIFAKKWMNFVFGEKSEITKAGVKGFLFIFKCGICCETNDYYGPMPCIRCGFTICTVCEMKLALQKYTRPGFSMIVSMNCSRCRYEGTASLVFLSNAMSHHNSKLTDIEKQKLIRIKGVAQDTMLNGGNSVAVNKWRSSMKDYLIMYQQNQRMKDQMDRSRCASCQLSFFDKRSNCSGCKKVSYCDKKCQKKHWTKHKNDCKLLKLFIDDEQ